MELNQPMSEAFRMIFDDEKTHRIKAEKELENTLAFLKVIEQQLWQARDERDKLKAKLEKCNC